MIYRSFEEVLTSCAPCIVLVYTDSDLTLRTIPNSSDTIANLDPNYTTYLHLIHTMSTLNPSYLRSLPSVRQRSALVYDLAKQGKLKCWRLDEEKMDAVVDYCIGTIQVRVCFRFEIVEFRSLGMSSRN